MEGGLWKVSPKENWEMNVWDEAILELKIENRLHHAKVYVEGILSMGFLKTSGKTTEVPLSARRNSDIKRNGGGFTYRTTCAPNIRVAGTRDRQ